MLQWAGVYFPGSQKLRNFAFYGQPGLGSSIAEHKSDEDISKNDLGEYATPTVSFSARARAPASAVPLTMVSAVMLLSHALLGSCSKGHLDANNTWSSAAFTVYCSFSRPRMFGFVVLDRTEGPLVYFC